MPEQIINGYGSGGQFPLLVNPDGSINIRLSGSGGGFVPYSGANSDVDLGTYNFTTTGQVQAGQVSVDNLFLDGHSILSVIAPMTISAGEDYIDLNVNDVGGILVEPTQLTLKSYKTNGFVKTTGGTGLLSVDTTSYVASGTDTLSTVTGNGAVTDTECLFRNNPSITLGRQSANAGTIKFWDDDSANSATLQPAKLTTAAYTVQFPDHAAGTVSLAYASSPGANQVCYFTTATNDIASSKYISVNAANGTMTLGGAGVDGKLTIYSEQGATDRTASIMTNTAMTASTTFYLPAAAPAGTYFLTMTSGGVMGFDSNTYLTSAANVALSNLSAVAINTTLVSDADNTDDLGTSSIGWKALYLSDANSTDVSTEGEIRYDSTNQSLTTFVSGMKQQLTGCIFTTTADATLTGTTTETTLIGSGVGTLTLPANFFVAGKSVRIRGGGYFTTPVSATTLAWKLKLGSVTIASNTGQLAPASQTNTGLSFDCIMTCRTTGASGTVYGQGIVFLPISTGSIGRQQVLVSTSASVVDTTASNTIDFTLTLTSGAGSDSYTVTNVIIEVIN